MLTIPNVSLYEDRTIHYPEIPPFHPDQNYPESPFYKRSFIEPGNQVYRAVRQALILLGLDPSRFQTEAWNPFKNLISPGNTVVIKPNAVLHLNIKPNEPVFASITHGSVLRAIIDYVYIALQGTGTLIVADAPLAHSDFTAWQNLLHLPEIVELYRREKHFDIHIFDLRNLYVPWDFGYGYAPSDKRSRAVRDPKGYAEIDLGALSEFNGFSEQDIRRLYGSDYNRETTIQHHLNGHHQYLMSKTILDADVLLSVPKLKVHKKVGITLNIKGMVGTQGDKNYIPHYRMGHPGQGGDEYPDQGILQNTLNQYRAWLETKVLVHENIIADSLYKKLIVFRNLAQHGLDYIGKVRYGDNYPGNILAGSWYGNDTAWRMSLDLIRLVLYADAAGRFHDVPQRKFFSVVDGIIGGEGEGPLEPSARQCGIIMAGFNPLAVDIAAARLIGYRPHKIPLLQKGMERPWLRQWKGDIEAIPVFSNIAKYRSLLINTDDEFLHFQRPKGWRNYYERAESSK